MARLHLSSLVFVSGLVAACTVAPAEEAGTSGAEIVQGSDAILDRARITSRLGDPSYQHARAPVTLPARRFAHATLIVDLESSCFPFTNWTTEPPPAGQRWPASCDAFDRIFEIALADPASAAPPLELVHAATPFGGPLHLEVDVTDVVNALSGSKRVLDAYISTMADAQGQVSGSDGGWNVSARIAYEEGPAPRDVIAVIPLTYGALGPASATTSYDFELPAGTSSTRVEYITSGHGLGADASCGSAPAEEFCRRSHALTIDGQPLATVDPWRTDCASLCTLVDGGPFGRYCKQNPCGSPSSVRFSRSNWCPGSMTAPNEIDGAGLAPGPHTLGLAISRIAERGTWRVSAKVFAYR